MIELPLSRCILDLTMRPVGFDGDEVTLQADVAPLHIETTISFDAMESYFDEHGPEDWREKDWINLRIAVRLV